MVKTLSRVSCSMLSGSSMSSASLLVLLAVVDLSYAFYTAVPAVRPAFLPEAGGIQRVLSAGKRVYPASSPRRFKEAAHVGLRPLLCAAGDKRSGKDDDGNNDKVLFSEVGPEGLEAGVVLVAAPDEVDHFFRHAVVLLLDHTPEVRCSQCPVVIASSCCAPRIDRPTRGPPTGLPRCGSRDGDGLYHRRDVHGT
jgi:hypothetical protein